MKRVFMSVLVCLSIQTWACDICGGGSHLFSSGLQPQFTRNFIGLQTSFRTFETSVFNEDTGLQLNSRERLTNMGVTMRIGWKNTVFFGATIPYVNNQRFFSDSTQHVVGWGDTQLNASYFVFRTADLNAKWRNFLVFTANAKIPFSKTISNEEQNIAVALRRSTHAFAFGLQLAYTGRTDHWGYSTSVSSAWNSRDVLHYKSGDSYAWNNSLNYFNHIKSVTFVAHLNQSLRLETADKEFSSPVHSSGTKRVLVGGGIDAYYKSWALTSSIQHGVINQASEGTLDARVEAVFSLIKFF